MLCGCSQGPLQVSGGTQGSLTAGEVPVPDFEIKIYQVGSVRPLGMGTTGIDGRFRLVQPAGNASLSLPTGEYAYTLESIGPESPRMPSTYSNAAKTPLKVKWRSEDRSLDLKIQAFK